MGLRETLNQNPAIATGGTLAIIVIAIGFIVYSQLGSSTPKAPSKAYYTIDDGKTYFTDDVKKVAPFDYEGKQAVKARVYECPGTSPFVGYLERYSVDAKKKIEEMRAATAAMSESKTPGRPPGDLQGMAMAIQMGMEVKKPGDAKWIKMMDFQNSTKITQVTCPDGKMEGITVVSP